MRRIQRTSSRLESFLQDNLISPSWLARDAGISRKNLLGLRRNEYRPLLETAERIRHSLSRKLRRDVAIKQLFNISIGKKVA
jgi:DNA-binding XRE family transcriptional regulator